MTAEILALTLEHLQLVFIAIAVASAAGLPLAVLLTRKPGARRLAVGFANIAQTIPSLALFGFLVPFAGIGKTTAVIALCLYALLPILRNTLTGILGVDRGVCESAAAMGMTGRQILLQVELPLATP
jgi:osmoprotectant transport system permease protein